MTTEQKVERVLEVEGRVPLGAALAVVGLARSTWHYHRRIRRSYEERYRQLRRPLQEIARGHPEYGYRRAAVELRAPGHRVNRRVVQRLHRLWDLPLLHGSPDDLEPREVPRPAVGDDDVLVRVRAASLHPDVWHVVTGRPHVLRLMGAGFSKPTAAPSPSTCPFAKTCWC